MGIAFLAGLGVSIALGLGLHLFTNAIPKLARIAVTRAARRLPVSMRQNQEAAWLADVANLETHFELLNCAFACFITSYRIRLPFIAEKSHRILNSARVVLRTHGAIASFALHRIKAWDTSTDPNNWTFCEKWCMGIIFASRAPIKQSMKNYFIALEHDIKERPRHYESQQEAAEDLFMPIWREIKIFQFLSKYDFGTTSKSHLTKRRPATWAAGRLVMHCRIVTPPPLPSPPNPLPSLGRPPASTAAPSPGRRSPSASPSPSGPR